MVKLFPHSVSPLDVLTNLDVIVEVLSHERCALNRNHVYQWILVQTRELSLARGSRVRENQTQEFFLQCPAPTDFGDMQQRIVPARANQAAPETPLLQ